MLSDPLDEPRQKQCAAFTPRGQRRLSCLFVLQRHMPEPQTEMVRILEIDFDTRVGEMFPSMGNPDTLRLGVLSPAD